MTTTPEGSGPYRVVETNPFQGHVCYAVVTDIQSFFVDPVRDKCDAMCDALNAAYAAGRAESSDTERAYKAALEHIAELEEAAAGRASLTPSAGEWTPEPWVIDYANREMFAVMDDDGIFKYLGACRPEDFSRSKVPSAVSEANAARIVACVNALAGLNPEAVPAMVEAIKAAIAAGMMPDPTTVNKPETVEATRVSLMMRAALALATGGGK